MSNWQDTLHGETATVEFGQRLADALKLRLAAQPSHTVHLHGELGAGKTTLVRGVLRAFGHSGAVKSPTYTLLEPYNCGGQQIYHFDLYRVNDPEELAFVGFDEIIDGEGLKVIEWPERADSWLPAPDTTVRLRVDDSTSRTATVEFSA